MSLDHELPSIRGVDRCVMPHFTTSGSFEMKKARCSAVAVAIMTLAACGGGGGDGANQPVPTSPTMAVTSANYVTVANESAAASSDVIDLSGDFGTLVGAQTVATPNWAAFGLSKAVDALNRFSQPSTVLVGAVLTETVACNSGTISGSMNDVNGNQILDGGESVRLTFNNCTEPTLGTVNGGLTVSLNAQPTGVVGGSVYTLDATLAFTSLAVNSANFRVTANGALRLVSIRTSVTTGSDVLIAPSFAVSLTAGGSTYSRSLSNYRARVDLTSAQTVTSFSGIVASSALNNGSVSVATVVPFVRATSALYPASGSATVTGTNGKATLTAIDATQVRIDLDADNDGFVDESQTRLWNSII